MISSLVQCVKKYFYKFRFIFRRFWSSVKNEKPKATLLRILHYVAYGKGVVGRDEIRTDGNARIRNIMDARPTKTKFTPKVSVIVPNYNHARFLKKRLDSVYGQTYQNFEVLLLDDKSTDESVAVLEEYAQKHADKTTCLFNKTNSGSVFHQWEKGIQHASGDLIWIAESDDFCDNDFLEKLVGFFYDESIMLASAHPVFVDHNGRPHTGTFENYVARLSKKKWKKTYIETAHTEVQTALGIKNTIPNVSGVVLRNNFDHFDFDALKKFTVCGDWFLYLTVIKGGRLAYCVETYNYYRMHPHGTCAQYQKNPAFVKEHESIAKYVAQNYNVQDDVFVRNMHAVKETWLHHKKDEKSFLAAYDIAQVRKAKQNRKPNIVIAVFAFSTGGGEVVPIRIANELKDRNYAVTVFDYCYFGRERETTRSLLRNDIPVFRSKRRNVVNSVLRDFGIEMIHTHHVTTDIYFAERSDQTIPHVVTMHGMYESLPKSELEYAKKSLCGAVSHWTYVAQKNIVPLLSDAMISESQCSKIPNGFRFLRDAHARSRASLSIDEDAFVVCLASRAMKEKGWREAVYAVKMANEMSKRKIILLLVGDGVMHDILKKDDVGNNVKLLGFQKHVAQFFAISDIGLLPTTFRGESYPMTLIECISTGTPFFATDIGEIRKMLTLSDGAMAGEIIEMDDDGVDVKSMARALARVANDEKYYASLQKNAQKHKSTFSMDAVMDAHEDVYEKLLRKK